MYLLDVVDTVVCRKRWKETGTLSKQFQKKNSTHKSGEYTTVIANQFPVLLFRIRAQQVVRGWKECIVVCGWITLPKQRESVIVCP